MANVYRDYHLTIIPYTCTDGGKECPNSAVEGLACGLPALITENTPFSRFIGENRCGVTTPAMPNDVANGLIEAISRYRELSCNARRTAEQHFSCHAVFNNYTNIYEKAQA